MQLTGLGHRANYFFVLKIDLTIICLFVLSLNPQNIAMFIIGIDVDILAAEGLPASRYVICKVEFPKLKNTVILKSYVNNKMDTLSNSIMTLVIYFIYLVANSFVIN